MLSAILPFVDLVAHLGGLMAGLLLGGALGRKQMFVVTAFDWVWLLACAVLCAIGWFVPEIFHEYFWRVWVAEDYPWIVDYIWWVD